MRSISALVLCTALTTPAMAETQLRAVTLSTAGVAMLDAEGQMGADGLRLTLRRADMDDFLKSLRLADPSGATPRLTMSGPGGLEDAFATLPFSPEALSDLSALIDAMQGAPARLTRRAATVEGRLMGTGATPCDDGRAGCIAVSLMDAEGQIVQLPLDDATTLVLDDPADRAALASGLDAIRTQGRASRVEVTIDSNDPTPRNVDLGWLQPAPVWKTAWRAVDGPEGLALTGWAVIENTTGQDWNDVSLTLATGAVRALDARLYDRVDAPREKAPQFAPMLAQSAVTRELAATPMVEAAPVQMTEGSSFSAYTLSEPVSLASGQMLSLPFLQEQAATERLTLYRGGSHAPHPMMALDVTNPLPLRLPAGVVTVYDAQRGHAGDAMMPELAPKDSALVEFAEDSAIRIREDLAEQARITEARIRDGVLIASERTERTTSYRAEGAEDGARVLTLLHPQRPGWDMQTEGGTSALDATRFTVDLPQGQITQFKVIETRTSRTQLALLDLSRDDLAYWEGRMPDAETRAFFADLRDLRQQQAALRTRIAETRSAEETLIADQDRLARLVDQLGDESDANFDRLARIDAIDAEIDSVRQERATLETQLRASEERMGALLR
ncbi:MAG: protein of unknown function containing DUF4139 domain [Roseibaca calidilacus]|uniref:DUF4139 domain-containing protein n=1 Tax=Roseibaca calidilacus TaxID=1666912 RepID=A0A0P7WF08_9RHOB|nr:hypothetical protein [Roseibaca calidilacus]KPP92626.1 MAG: protein of unknown function containing DUF4139 domain [Roseibaca calidilacus]CUX80302.1 protein of unknown function (DUF4139) [Roseibaca calidilacus]